MKNVPVDEKLCLLAAFDQALGLDLLTIGRADLRIQPKDAQIAPEEIEAELDRRQAARAEKDFALSDEIRDTLIARSEEHTSELQSLMRISYAVFCLKKKQRQSSTEQTQHNDIR